MLVKKIPDINVLMTATVVDTKIGEVENKTSGVRSLVTTIVLNAKVGEVGNEILDVSNFLRKTDYNTKISEIEGTYFTISDYKNSDLKTKFATLAVKAELKAEKDNVVKCQAFGSSYFLGESRFKDDGTQNYLMLYPVYRYLKRIAKNDHISAWK